MMQDLSFGKLENEFRNQPPQPEDLVICFQNQQILLHRAEDNSISFPRVAELDPWTETWKPWFAEGFRYVFRMQEKNYFLWLGDVPEQEYGAYSFEPMRMLRYKGISDLLFGAFTAWHVHLVPEQPVLWLLRKPNRPRCSRTDASLPGLRQHDLPKNLSCGHCGCYPWRPAAAQ